MRAFGGTLLKFPLVSTSQLLVEWGFQWTLNGAVLTQYDYNGVQCRHIESVSRVQGLSLLKVGQWELNSMALVLSG